jgi:hypothetical protein
MSDAAPTLALPSNTQAAPLAILAALYALLVGGSALALGVVQNSSALWGFGAACLLQLPLALSLWGRIRDGLGNRGLERELRTLRVVSYGLRLVALGLAAAAAIALLGQHVPDPSWFAPGLALLAVGLQALLWSAKRALAEAHPSLALDAARARALLELAALLLAGTAISHWVPQADAVTGLAMALRLYFEGRSLAVLSAFKAACGGCGTGCGC